MGPRATLSGLLLAGLAVLHAGRAAADGASTGQIAALVRSLGASSFQERQRASQELTALGPAAREALRDATRHADAEVRSRAREALAEIDSLDFQVQLQAFIADYDGKLTHTLPGWDDFAKRVGTTRRARDLFVAIQRQERDLMAAYADGPAAATEALRARCHHLYEQIVETPSGRDSLLSLDTAAALLFVGSAPGVAIDEQPCGAIFQILMLGENVKQQLQGGKWSLAVKRLYGDWIVKDALPMATPDNLRYAALYGLDQEGLSVAQRLLESGPAISQIQFHAILFVGRFGSLEHVRLLEKYLNDASICSTVRIGDRVEAPGPREGQRADERVPLLTGDVALAALLQITGQNAEDYGFVVKQNPYLPVFHTPLIAFRTASDREQAKRRWRQWVEAQQEPAGRG